LLCGSISMTVQSIFRSGLRWAAAGVGLAAGTYVTYVGVTWSRYGHPPRPSPDEHDELLDRFMPVCEIVERHHVHVTAPAPVTLAVARNIDLYKLPLVRAVFRGRELILGATPPDSLTQVHRLLTDMQSLGWVVLAESPGKEIVVGAVTKPWEANVIFRSLPSEEFAAFTEPDYVKIVWTLRADEMGAKSSVFRTETRAIATNACAREKFRMYWSLLSPGILLIRRMMLRSVKVAAEHSVLTQQGWVS